MLLVSSQDHFVISSTDGLSLLMAVWYGKKDDGLILQQCYRLHKYDIDFLD
jgi:hypothetical protein